MKLMTQFFKRVSLKNNNARNFRVNNYVLDDLLYCVFSPSQFTSSVIEIFNIYILNYKEKSVNLAEKTFSWGDIKKRFALRNKSVF